MALIPPDFHSLRLRTPRLELEPVTEAHAPEFFELFADPELHVYVPFEPPALEVQRARCARWAQRISPAGDEIWLNWAARDRETKRVVAHFQAGTKDWKLATVGYLVARDCQGRGVAFEGMTEIFQFLRDGLGIAEVRAWTDTRNMASQKLAQKLGMKEIEHIKNADFFKGAPSDEFVYAIKWKERS